MFGIDISELLLLALLAVIFIKPQDLPKLLYQFASLLRQIANVFYLWRQNISTDFELMMQSDKKSKEEDETRLSVNGENKEIR